MTRLKRLLMPQARLAPEDDASAYGVLPPVDAPISVRRRNWRMFKDGLARYGMVIGGIGVIVALLLMFLYLMYMVLPLFRPATLQVQASYLLPGPAGERTLALGMDDQGEVGVRFTDAGRAVFFKTRDGTVISEQALPLPPGVQVTSFAHAAVPSSTVFLGLSNGEVLAVQHSYRVGYAKGGDQRIVTDYKTLRSITPEISYPLGDKPVQVDPKGQALRLLNAQSSDQGATLAAYTGDKRVVLTQIVKQESLLGDASFERHSTELPALPAAPALFALNEAQDRLFIATGDGHLLHYDVTDKAKPVLLENLRPVPEGTRITALDFLVSGISLMIGSSDGRIAQWFPVRDINNDFHLMHVRDFDPLPGAVVEIAPEYRRKGFMALGGDDVGLYHATAHRTLLIERVGSHELRHMAQDARGNAALMQDNAGRLHFATMRNEHPEVSWSALWSKVWYEGRSQPEYIWQSSAATSDFEPKYSLVPISFGTLKAAFYAMIVAVPLSVLGAIFAAYFMAPRMRQIVKPSIELMAALPTVILGFLAGLWLAPLVDSHLPGIFTLLLLLPPGILLAAYAWHRLPRAIRHRIPDGWEAALLIPVVIVITYLAMALSPALEIWLFHGDMPKWLSNELGIGYEQRNAIVVGLAMGFAVIPNIFSIAEDAVFTVPRHLTIGSLALGATPWQTLTRVVLLTASPGIFSAVMIGLGRAVGETMIVLMATGNTPVTSWNLFEGLRTLSANIAVEMPETEVNSTHYRILFLTGLLLFFFTLIFNTAAEIVRQKLRRRYSSL